MDKLFYFLFRPKRPCQRHASEKTKVYHLVVKSCLPAPPNPFPLPLWEPSWAEQVWTRDILRAQLSCTDMVQGHSEAPVGLHRYGMVRCRDILRTQLGCTVWSRDILKAQLGCTGVVQDILRARLGSTIMVQGHVEAI